MNLMPIKKKRVYQEIIAQIKAAIEANHFHPGDQLPSERNLSEQLAVSRTSVKEAISVLESAGIVEIKPGIGVFLRNRSSQDIVHQMNSILNQEGIDIAELMELRQAIEGESAYYAAIRSDESDKEEILQAYEKLEQAVANQKVAAVEDYEFHMAVSRAAKNTLVTKVMYLISDILLEHLAQYRTHSLNTPGRTTKVLFEHKRIYHAISQGNAEEARQAMLDHLKGVREKHL
ncbi:FadR/GntR family transcriptional regulator [Bacillus tianshenii]|nr:FadR/GntR family transcriptional regulator [Bacillus tianshenii]